MSFPWATDGRDRTVLAFVGIVLLGAAITLVAGQQQCAALDAAYEDVVSRYAGEYACSTDADCTVAYGRLCQIYPVPESFAQEPVQIWSSYPSCSVTADCLPRNLRVQCVQDRCQLRL